MSESAINTLNAKEEADANPYEDEPTMTHEFCVEHRAAVERIARNEFKRSEIFTVDDVEQAIWLTLAQKWENIRSYPAKNIVQLAHMAAAEWCKQQRLAYSYFCGKVIYTPEEVKRILIESAWEDLGPGIDVEGRVDVRTAFATLTPTLQRAVFRKYGAKEENLPANVRVGASRGIRLLTNQLNAHLTTEQKDIEEL